MRLSKAQLTILLLSVSFVCAFLMLLNKPIPQDTSFHLFADSRSVFFIDHFWNVVSNLLFLLIGIAAIKKLWQNNLMLIPETKMAYYIFFIGVLLIAFGSAWYHHKPNNTTLAWDRLPMTIAFMSLLSIALAEFISVNAARIGLIPFLFIGIFSIVWWQNGELHHRGDLRLYALVQFLPILLLTLLFLFGRSVYSTWGYLALFTCYLLAKLAEHFDYSIFHFTNGLIAGHVVKHAVTAAGLWLFMVYLQKRESLKL